MLGKLVKYEFKATARLFLLAYAVVIILAGLNAAVIAARPRGTSSLAIVYSIMASLTMVVFAIAAIAVFVMTLVIIVVRCYRMLGDEGYLWFTLPVTPAQHIWAKLIPGFIWTVATTVVTAVSIGLVTWPAGWYQQIRPGWDSLVAKGYNPGAWVTLGVLFVFLALLVQIVMAYASMAVGPNLVKSSRLGGSVLAYVIFYTAMQVISLVVLGIVALMLKDVISSLVSAGMSGSTSFGPNDLSPAQATHVGLVFGVLFGAEYLVLAVASFLITRYFIGRKLNLA